MEYVAMDSDPYQYLITLSLTVCRVNSQFRCAHDWPVIYELPFGDIHSGRPWDKVCLLRAAYCCFECAHGWPVIYEVPFRDLLSWVRGFVSCSLFQILSSVFLANCWHALKACVRPSAHTWRHPTPCYLSRSWQQQ